MITVKVDRKSVKNVEQRLGKLKSQTPKVIARAVNDTARSARMDLARKAKEAYTVKTTGLKNHMKIRKATVGNLMALIQANGRPLLISSFKTSIPRSGVKADIVKTGLKQVIKNGNKAFKRNIVLARKGSGRYPLQAIYSASVPGMLGSEQRVYGVIKPKIESDLHKNIERHISWVLSGG